MKLPKAGIGMDRVAPVLNWKYLQQWARNEHGGGLGPSKLAG